MSESALGRILVVDDNLAIHDDFRKVLNPEPATASSYDAAAATLFRRSARPLGPAPLQMDFATQGQEGFVLAQAAAAAGQPYAMAFVDMRMPPGWDGLETISHLWSVQPTLLVVICTAFSDYSWEQIHERLGQSDRLLILKKPFDNVEVRQLAHSLSARARIEASLQTTQLQLLDASRRAGMAEVATGILHNVGNVLNSVNVSATLVSDELRRSKTGSLALAVAMLSEHRHDLGQFLTEDPRGRELPAFLTALSEHLCAEQAGLTREIEDLRSNIEHIRQIVAMQQSYATVSGALERLALAELVEDALRMASIALNRHHVEVVRDFHPVPPVVADRHMVLQILVNLISNAKQALDARPDQRRLTLRIAAESDGLVQVQVIDNGAGIAPEHLSRIFNYGFTTKGDGHGFGLHSGANAVKEMGGNLVAHSEGLGTGATFTLEFPTEASAGTRQSA